MNASCNCGITWHQSGNLTGHCTMCHRTFQGIKAFDRHQHIDYDVDPQGRNVCTDPVTMTRRDGDPVYESQVTNGVTYWSMSQSEAEKAAYARQVAKWEAVKSQNTPLGAPRRAIQALPARPGPQVATPGAQRP